MSYFFKKINSIRVEKEYTCLKKLKIMKKNGGCKEKNQLTLNIKTIFHLKFISQIQTTAKKKINKGLISSIKYLKIISLHNFVNKKSLINLC